MRSFLLMLTVVLAACGSEFESRTILADSDPVVLDPEFEFPGGEVESEVLEGDAVVVTVRVPTAQYQLLLTAGPEEGGIDATRLSLTADRDLGDPDQGGFAAGESVTDFLLSLGLIGAEDPDGEFTPIAVEIPTAGELSVPLGATRWSLVVVDDEGSSSGPLTLELVVISRDKPTAIARLEIPPQGDEPSGTSLPLDVNDRPFIGESLPFVLVVEAVPGVESGERFDLLYNGVDIDPARLLVMADRDLGDPGSGGFAAGENLASLFGQDFKVIVDPDTGALTLAALVPIDAEFAPALGVTGFLAAVVDDADAASAGSTIELAVAEEVTLSLHIQPDIFSASCTSVACHDAVGPREGLDLTPGSSFDLTVNVRSNQTPDDSCATLRVEPYSPSGSYLLHKMNDTYEDACVGGFGRVMPTSGKLSQDKLDLMDQWVLQGAHDR